MVLLTRLAKQVYRRSTEDLLGMHMRLLMALSFLRDHDNSYCPRRLMGVPVEIVPNHRLALTNR